MKVAQAKIYTVRSQVDHDGVTDLWERRARALQALTTEFVDRWKKEVWQHTDFRMERGEISDLLEGFFELHLFAVSVGANESLPDLRVRFVHYDAERRILVTHATTRDRTHAERIYRALGTITPTPPQHAACYILVSLETLKGRLMVLNDEDHTLPLGVDPRHVPQATLQAMLAMM